MGLLDDAIREHLDLKRRRGADPAEVERAEQEALGPVRRNRDPGETADPEDQAPVPGGFAYDQDDDEEWHEGDPPGADLAEPRAGADLMEPETEFEDEEPEFDPVVPPEPAERGSLRPRSLREPEDYEAPSRGEVQPSFDEPAPPPADDPGPSARDWSAADDEAFVAEPFPTSSGSPRRSADDVGQETTEYHIEGAVEDEGEDEHGEDMLEETPEFLQDTPDHDRLWFEQRPPRDFDFDG
jgi:hypothetical protein